MSVKLTVIFLPSFLIFVICVFSLPLLVNAVRGLIILLIFILVKSLGFLKIYFIDYAITVVTFFSPLYFPPPCTTPPTIIPQPQFMSMGHTYKFFGFSISHTILNLLLSILYLPIMFLIPCTFLPILKLYLFIYLFLTF